MKVTDEMVGRFDAALETDRYPDLTLDEIRVGLEAALAGEPEWPQEMLDERQAWVSRACAAEARAKELEAFSAKHAQQALGLMQERNAHSARVLELQAKLARICEWMKTGALEASLFDELHEILESP